MLQASGYDMDLLKIARLWTHASVVRSWLLDLLVLACLEKRREDRPQRVADLIEAFDSLALEHRWTQREAELWWSALPPVENR